MPDVDTFAPCLRDTKGYPGMIDAAYLEVVAATLEGIWSHPDEEREEKKEFVQDLLDEYMRNHKEFKKRCLKLSEEMRTFANGQRVTTRFEVNDALRDLQEHAKTRCGELFPEGYGAAMLSEHLRKKGVELTDDLSPEIFDEKYEWGSDMMLDDARFACERFAKKFVKNVRDCMKEEEEKKKHRNTAPDKRRR